MTMTKTTRHGAVEARRASRQRRDGSAAAAAVGGGTPVEGVEAEGRTVNEATDKALEQLGLRRDQVDVEVLSEGRPRLLGFRGEPARVRVTPLPEPRRRRPARPSSRPRMRTTTKRTKTRTTRKKTKSTKTTTKTRTTKKTKTTTRSTRMRTKRRSSSRPSCAAVAALP